MKAQGLQYVSKSSDAKEPHVERRIRTIKERNRATHADLTFKLFGVLLVYSVLNNVRCINFFPCTASPLVAPREIYCGIRGDLKRDSRTGFGYYCLVYDTGNKHINSSQRRMEECIALYCVGNKGGDVHVYSSRRARVSNRNRIQPFPTPDSVIAFLNKAYAAAMKRDYSLPPVYRTYHHLIDEDGPVENQVGMDAPVSDELPMHGRESAATVECEAEAPEAEPEPRPGTTPVEECMNAPPEVEETIPDEELAEVAEDELSADDTDAAEVVPTNYLPAARYPKRPNRTTRKDKIFHIAVRTALKQYGRKGLVSMVKESRSVAVEKEVFIPINPNKLSKSKLKTVISSSLFLTEKFNPDGSFEKLKARIVADGHLQDRGLYEKQDISSPTVNT